MIGTRNIRNFSVFSVFSSQIVEFGIYQRFLEHLLNAALLIPERMPAPVLSNTDFNRFTAQPITVHCLALRTDNSSNAQSLSVI